MREMRISIALMIAILFIVGCGTETSKVDDNAYESPAGKELSLVEKFDFRDLEGNKLDWAETKGKLVFVNFWATWCKPCIKEMPSVSEANIQLNDNNVLFIVASDEDVDKISKFESKHHYSFKLMQSKTSVFDLGIQALPTTLIINENGEIVFNEIGSRDWASEKSIALIKSFSTKK